ncbi:hypothetical protein PCORN_18871 [Listeria cornellensis FSL F6-0969]|uniref:Uncharacterized protein n=1 Tax=Listeria cornellensis FSL F6-0969 TaxID=1265820 RepID=W7BA48_9LIST|nr:hypothetical protein PCORN_18871 [Listeria cornellensis FSL F6-0969]
MLLFFTARLIFFVDFFLLLFLIFLMARLTFFTVFLMAFVTFFTPFLMLLPSFFAAFFGFVFDFLRFFLEPIHKMTARIGIGVRVVTAINVAVLTPWVIEGTSVRIGL